MKMYSVGLFFLGIILMALSGLEKILIYLAFNGDIQEIQTLIDLTPPYIWNITNITLGTGITAIVIAMLLSSHYFYNKRPANNPQLSSRESDEFKSN